MRGGSLFLLVNAATKATSEIDPQEAQQTLEIAEANLRKRKTQGKRQTIEAN